MAGATTWDELVAQKEVASVVLVEAKAGQLLTNWIASSGFSNVWQSSFPQYMDLHSRRTISKLSANGDEDYTLRGSIAAVDAAPSSYFVDYDAELVYVRDSGAEPTMPRLLVVAEFTLYFCGGNPKFRETKKPVVFNGNLYEPYLSDNSIPRISIQASDPLSGVARISGFDVALINARGSFDALAARYLWTGRDVVVKAGGDDLPYSEYQTQFTGRINGVRWSELAFTLVLSSKATDLDSDLTAKITADDLAANFTFTHCLVIDRDNQTQYMTVLARPMAIINDYAQEMTPFRMTAGELSDASQSLSIGKTKPMIFGQVTAHDPVDLAETPTSSRIMRMIAGHPIQGITGIRDRNGALYYGRNVYRIYLDLVNGVVIEDYYHQSTLDTNDDLILDPDLRPYSYDVNGFPNTDGTVQKNPAEVARAIIEMGPDGSQLPAEERPTFDETAYEVARVYSDLFTIGYRIAAPITKRSALEAVMRCASMQTVVNPDGSYYLVVYTPKVLNSDATIIDLGDEDGGIISLEMSSDDYRLMRTVIVSYGYTSNENQSVYATSGTLREAKSLVPKDSVITFESPLADSESAAICAERIAKMRANPTRLFTVATRMRAAKLKIYDVVSITRERIPSDALGKIYARIIGMDTSLSNFTQTLMLVDMSTLLEVPSQAFIKSNDTPLALSDASDVQKLTTGFYADSDDLIDPANLNTFKQGLWF